MGLSKLTPQQREDICNLMEQGVTNREIVSRYSISSCYAYVLYERMRDKTISGRRLNVHEVTQKDNRATLNQLIKVYPIEPFDEPGWEEFGMIVID